MNESRYRHTYHDSLKKDGDRCAAYVSGGWRGGQCHNKGKHEDKDSKGHKRMWCGSHHPTRRIEKKREWETAKRQVVNVCKSLTPAQRKKLPDRLQKALGILDGATRRFNGEE